LSTTGKPMGDAWITDRVAEALKTSPVADAVASAIEEQLKGTMRERTLRSGELSELAKSLLTAVTKPLDGEPAG
jgi:hypothetical protein